MKKQSKCRTCGSRTEDGLEFCKECHSIQKQLDSNTILMEMREPETMSDRERKNFLKRNKNERQKLMRMKREDRLQKVCRDSIFFAYAIGRVVGLSVARRDLKETTGVLARGSINDIANYLTYTLRKAKVLPLGR